MLLHADDIGVLARVLGIGDTDAAVVGLLLLHFALGVAGSHGPVIRAPFSPTSSCFSACSPGLNLGSPFISNLALDVCGKLSRLGALAQA